MTKAISFIGMFFCIMLSFASTGVPMLEAMQAELDYSLEKLENTGKAPMYFMQYQVTETKSKSLTAKFGAMSGYNENHMRFLDVDIRVGDYSLDNTREISDFSFSFDMFDYMPSKMVLDDDPDVIRQIIWLKTQKEFDNAQEQYIKVVGDKNIKVARRDTSGDFSKAEPSEYVEPIIWTDLDSTKWRSKIENYSKRFTGHDHILNANVYISCETENKFIVNSDGSKIQQSSPRYHLSINASTKADDGMVMYLHQPYITFTEDELPSDEQILSDIDGMIEDLAELQKAPLVEPYTGPAILKNQAAAVFFHEIFGHRIEGHRQKNEDFAQTFTQKVGEKILPDFISVYDDPTINKYNNTSLNGYYEYDDEGVKSEKVTVVKDGVLDDFLMSRSPIEGFQKSNGHGRRNYNNDVCTRMGNTIVESSKQVSFQELREQLIEECKKQNKPFGLIFEEISGGFTMTQRYLPQSFKVLPLKVKRVYVDGRPDELVRGVDIVGTPLTSFSKIVSTADDPFVFNGTCGAESGPVPVSGISPSLLVTEIEVEKKSKSKEKPPILPQPPIKGEAK